MQMIKQLSVLLWMLPLACFSQKNLKPATLTTTSNQTLRGVVDDREWFGNPAEIAFKAEGSSTFKKYSAQEALAIKIDKGSQYFSKTVTLDKTNDRLLEVDDRLDSSHLSYKTVTLFLKAEILSDKINLYSVTDQKLHLFAEKPGTPIAELIYRKYRLRRNGNLFEEEDKTYTDQLTKLFADCGDLAEQQFDTEFTLSAIGKQMRKYIICTEGKTDYQKKVPGGKIGIGAIAGTAFSSFRFVPKQVSGTTVLYNTDLNSQQGIIAGLRLQYLVPGRQQRISVVGDIYYTNYKGDLEQNTAYTNPTFYTKRKVALDFSMLRSDILFRYAVVSKNDWQAFANIGLSFTMPLSDKSTTTDTDVFNTNTTVTTKKTFEASGGLRSLTLLVTGGAGVSYRQFGLEYRLFKTGRIANGVFYPVDFQSHQVILCYRFK
jgi:Outer membrane protein beta-barrel domain